MPHILIVDADPEQRTTLIETLQSVQPSIHAESLSSPAEALQALEEREPDLLIVDHELTEMSGLELIRRCHDLPSCADTLMVLITAPEEYEVRDRALTVGVTDFLGKPLEQSECLARLRNLLALRHGRRLERLVEGLRHREEEALIRLGRAGEYHERSEVSAPSSRVGQYARLIAEACALPEDDSRAIEIAAPMHDIGKIGIPDDVLHKRGKLSREEYETVKAHTRIGHDLLADGQSAYLQLAARIALSHHERYDGYGYPDGLRGEEIPIAARIVSIADVFDALTSPRPYKKPWAPDKAIRYMAEQSGSQFDPACLEAFLAHSDDLIALAGGHAPECS